MAYVSCQPGLHSRQQHVAHGKAAAFGDEAEQFLALFDPAEMK
jgi:hypothetical protein